LQFPDCCKVNFNGSLNEPDVLPWDHWFQ
jgi:F-box/leucine-rich repeat protein 2/20